ncbi:hypothetical protein SARC_07510 [Sphaeroforma arctica JP610]|uniref:Uncharacterized protein n=1 Tax=Sphaeroforma arctica JP610 TaxID=667725 RepID=A0A0L0FW21_9EUKA|nr:hypothetical protein SARC_07510 [Sphaeroforma arctica JP610]KNC80123.1 hypothetical protein SARC_07510 [Sphaeroforma arctica JP610]|eukprot:XP_014154025.1 hypothetical protein SARC_07510 [Sphaeroforma arctica JP610]
MYKHIGVVLIVACSCNIFVAEGKHVIGSVQIPNVDDSTWHNTDLEVDQLNNDAIYVATKSTSGGRRRESDYPGTILCNEKDSILCDDGLHIESECCEYANCDEKHTPKCDTEMCCYDGRGINIDVDVLNVAEQNQVTGIANANITSTKTRLCKNTNLFTCPAYHDKMCCDNATCEDEEVEQCSKELCCDYPGTIACKDMQVVVTCNNFRDRECCEEADCSLEPTYVCSDLVCCTDPRPVKCEKVVECDRYRYDEYCCDEGPPCDDSYTLACTTDTCCDTRVYEGTIDCAEYPYFACKTYYPGAQCCPSVDCDEAGTADCDASTCCETEHEITEFDEYHFAPIITNYYNPADGSRPGYTRYFCVQTDYEHWFLMQTTPNSRLCAANEQQDTCLTFATKQDCRNLIYYPDNPIRTDNALYDYRVPAAGAVCMHQSTVPYVDTYLQLTYNPETRRSSCVVSLGLCVQYIGGEKCADDLILISNTTQQLECTDEQMLMVDHWCYQASTFLSYYL